MNENKIQPMYESIPAVANLNQVSGFNPLKFLRRATTEHNESVLQLDLRYKKLWFRLANPQGRIRFVNLHITDQLAIIEAKIFLNRNDTESVSSFTARCSIDEDKSYIEAAQNKALNEALSNAGFGLQFSDVSVGTAGEPYGSIVPTAEQAVSQTATVRPEPQAAAVKPESQTAAMKPEFQATAVKPESQTTAMKPESQATAMKPESQTTAVKSDPQAAAINAPEELKTEVLSEQSLPVMQSVATEQLPADKTVDQNNDSSPQTLPVTPEPDNNTASTKEAAAELLSADTVPTNTHVTVLNGGKEVKSPSIADSAKEALAVMTGQTERQTEATNKQHQEPAHTQTQTQTISPSAYTADMPVEQIVELMTVEEARQVHVDIGTCNGWTMAEVAERRSPSLRWYIFGYQGNNNILRAAAQVMLNTLEAQKAS